MNEKIYAVAVDGPSGAGKSTLAKAAAERLGILYVDTGAIYRSIGYYIYKNGMDPKDAAAVVAVLPQIRVEGPKISRNLTTAWFAERVDGRRQQCVARDADGGGRDSRARGS